MPFLKELSWEAFNVGTTVLQMIEQLKSRTGYYPQDELSDKIYCNRTNRSALKELKIELIAKPLSRPKACQIIQDLGNVI